MDQSPHFTRLPPEVHANVLSFLPSNRDVAALSASCRLFHGLCDMGKRREYRRLRVVPKPDSLNRTFNRLLEILKRPSIGRYVREIHFHTDLRFTLIRMHLAPSDNGHHLDPEEIKLLQNSSYGVYMAQVLALLLIIVSPNVEYIRIPAPFQSLATYLQDGEPTILPENVEFPILGFLRRINANPEKRFLQNLRSVYIATDQDVREDPWPGYYCPLDFTRCMALFRVFPAVEEIMANSMEPILSTTPFLRMMRAYEEYMDDAESHHPLSTSEQPGAADTMDDEESQSPLPAPARIVMDTPQEDIMYDVSWLKPASTNFSTITMMTSSVDCRYMAAVTLSSKELRSFTYGVGGRGRIGNGFPIFNPKTFIQAMLMHKTTLDRLHMDIDGEWLLDDHMTPEEEQEVEAVFDRFGGRHDMSASPLDFALPGALWEQSGSLRDFHALKTLEMGLRFLNYFARGILVPNIENFNLVDHLPPNLETLTIRGYESGANAEHDAQVNALRALQASPSSKLTELDGVDRFIPDNEHIQPVVTILHRLGGRLDDRWSEDGESVPDPDSNLSDLEE
ncbi:hypothetical protein P170DRAFT_513108 [Aspergillus steynii IBT 23096]|uniref:F-box domain-containing protein n=1 Tax=Aspergillus steynii IBT 23096 TaxID=1392250 RepID=A0A2I2FWJ9_9EURO|nr:uncharacterized protein P170DRAFT_513108 [Aspergillus steynii IBT 23096]PLB45023.1 hypothetical protein P170DRAFT_513108 [Aspergillus steynii IBT 23096]